MATDSKETCEMATVSPTFLRGLNILYGIVVVIFVISFSVPEQYKLYVQGLAGALALVGVYLHVVCSAVDGIQGRSAAGYDMASVVPSEGRNAPGSRMLAFLKRLKIYHIASLVLFGVSFFVPEDYVPFVLGPAVILIAWGHILRFFRSARV